MSQIKEVDLDEREVNLTEDALDLLFYYIIKDEIRQTTHKLDKETEEQVVKVSLYRTEDVIIDEIMSSHIEVLKQDMYEKFLD